MWWHRWDDADVESLTKISNCSIGVFNSSVHAEEEWAGVHRQVWTDWVTRVPGIHSRDGYHGDVAGEHITEQGEANVPVTSPGEHHGVNTHVATGGQDVIKGPMVSWYVQLFPVPACYTRDTAVSGFEGYFVGDWTVK